MMMHTYRATLLAIAMMLFSAGQAQIQFWIQIPVPTDHQLNTIDFPSASVGYIGGNDSLLLKTTDGGLTWDTVNSTGITWYPGGEHFMEVRFTDEQTGFATTGPYGGLYRTTDGGLTWTQESVVLSQCYFDGLFMIDSSKGFVGGSGCFYGEALSFLDQGAWNFTSAPASSNPVDGISAIHFLDPNYGLASSTGNRIYRTVDGGMTWDSVPGSPVADAVLHDILIVDDTLAFAAVDDMNANSGMLISKDSGKTWQEEVNSTNFFYPNMFGLHKSGDGTFYSGGRILGHSGTIRWYQAGTGWNGFDTDQEIFALSSHSDSIVFAVGDSGFVATNMDTTLMRAVTADDSPDIRVYPNPVDDRLRVEVAGPTPMRLELYDLAGRLHFRGELQNGAAEVNTEQLPAGMYMLRLTDGTRSWGRRVLKR